MKHILVDVPVEPAGLRELEALPGVAVRVTEAREEVRRLPADLILDVNVLLCTCPPANLADMQALEWVQISSVGYSQLVHLGLSERGVRATNARGVFDPTIAEWNLAMMVNLARDLRGMIRHQEHGVWERPARFQAEIRGKVVGLWGYGGIGRATARLAKAYGLTVHALTRRGVSPRLLTYGVPGTGDPEGVLPDRVFTAGQERAFLQGLDFLVLSLPLMPATTGLVGEAELRALPPRAFILNPARGPLIREEALLQALREGWIAGAALDTHYYYPMPADHPLWRFPNVILTPHVSGSSLSPYFLERLWDLFVQNVKRFLAGQPLLNELTAAELSGA
jgi:phosphoglycerate dehydrogenase-like enzyme